MSRFVLLVVLVGVSGGAAAQTTGESPFSITVRSHKLSISPEEFGAARDLTGTILGDAGIAVTWLRCPPGDPAHLSPRCLQPLDADEVILRIETAPRRSRRPAPVPDLIPQPGVLGTSYVDRSAAAGALATVYSDRVRDLSRGTRVASDALLARAIAHEIGHLLMGTTRHASTGLMRGRWSRDDVRRNQAEDWRFSEAESRAMRTAVSIRNALKYARHRAPSSVGGTRP